MGMKAILIFAGKSTRFWPLAEKSFTSIVGKTLLEHQVNRLQDAGVKEIVLVGGAHNMRTAKSLFPKLQLIEQRDLELGMRGALLSALPKVSNSPVMLVSANDVLDPSAYRDLLKKFSSSSADGMLLARKVRTYFPGGYLTTKGKRITGIIEKPGAGKEPSKLVNIVAHIHRDPIALLGALKDTPKGADDGYERALTALCAAKKYEALAYEGSWQAVKYPWHLLPLLELLLPSLTRKVVPKSAKVHPSAVIDGSVVLGERVRVLPHATIVGPAYIGDDVVIGNNALIRQASIGERCVIGYNTEVVRSVIGCDVWTHSSYIGDSVIDDNVSFGGGTTIGNLRLDEGEVLSMVKGELLPTGQTKFGAIIGSGCRTGIHTCIAPGVKIGANTFTYANTLITTDIPENSFVKPVHSTIEVRPNKRPPPKPEARNVFKKQV